MTALALADRGIGASLVKQGVVLARGGAATWDEAVVEGLSPFLDPADNKWCGTYTGYTKPLSGEYVGKFGSIGIAETTDLVSWTKYGSNPVHVPLLKVNDEGTITGSFMWVEAGVYHLFYCSCPGEQYEGDEAGGNRTLCHATASSRYGPFTRDAGNPILSNGGSGWRKTNVWRPCIVKVSSTYYLFVNCTGDPAPFAGTESIGYATASSISGPWTWQDGSNPLLIGSTVAADWDYQFCSDPWVYQANGVWYMNYASASKGDGKATTSTFPTGWSKLTAINPVLSPGVAGSADSYAEKGAIIQIGDKTFHYYTVRPDVYTAGGATRADVDVALAVSTTGSVKLRSGLRIALRT